MTMKRPWNSCTPTARRNVRTTNHQMLGTDASPQGGVQEPTGNATPTTMPNTGTNSQNPDNMQCMPENKDFHTPMTALEPCPTVPIQREDEEEEEEEEEEEDDEDDDDEEEEEGIEQKNSEKIFWKLSYVQDYSKFLKVMRKVEDIINSNHAYWPAWEEVSKYHLDLWYKDFKEYYYWLPENESRMRQFFENCTSMCIEAYEEAFEQENSEKTFLNYTFFEESSNPTEDRNKMKRKVVDILDSEYIICENWPTWEIVSPSQLDLWYEKFKEYYCWLPTHDSHMRTIFELMLQLQLNLEEHSRLFKNRLKKEYKAMYIEYEKGKRPIEYKDKGIEKFEQIWLDPPQ